MTVFGWIATAFVLQAAITMALPLHSPVESEPFLAMLILYCCSCPLWLFPDDAAAKSLWRLSRVAFLGTFGWNIIAPVVWESSNIGLLVPIAAMFTLVFAPTLALCFASPLARKQTSETDVPA